MWWSHTVCFFFLYSICWVQVISLGESGFPAEPFMPFLPHCFPTASPSVKCSNKILPSIFRLWTTSIWSLVNCFVPFPEAKPIICAGAWPALALGLLLRLHLPQPWCVYHHVQAAKSIHRMKNIVSKHMLFKSSWNMKNMLVYFEGKTLAMYAQKRKRSFPPPLPSLCQETQPQRCLKTIQRFILWKKTMYRQTAMEKAGRREDYEGKLSHTIWCLWTGKGRR